MNNYGIEYSHIYTDQSFDEEQSNGINELKKKESSLNNNPSPSRLVLIDDYSPAISFERFNLQSFLKQLEENKALPDVIVRESSLTKFCQMTLDLMVDGRVKHQLMRYIQSRKKFPCSLFIASWYLLRLGAFGKPRVEIAYGNEDKIFSKEIITILPDSFQTPERNATDIISSTKFNDLNKKIERIFFYHTRSTYSKWDDFDPYEYLERNYGREILAEDKKIIERCIRRLQEFSIPLGSLLKVADIGTGPNLYPAMIISPYVSSQGHIELLDIAKPNLYFLRELLKESSEEINNWIKFEKLMCGIGGKLYRNVLKRALGLVEIKKRSIYNLLDNQYEIVTCFFVTEGIHDDQENFKRAVQSLISSVKPGGLVITAHMIGSRGYYAGERTSFPSVNLTVTDLEVAFNNLENLTIDLIGHDNQKPVRLGYHGMALVIGRKKS